MLQEQYTFVHDAVLESLTCGTTEIQSRDFIDAVDSLYEMTPKTGKSGFQSQFDVCKLIINPVLVYTMSTCVVTWNV